MYSEITSCSILSGHRPVKIRRAAIVGAEYETLCIYDFLYANLLRGRVVNFRGEKVIKDGGHQGKN